MKSTEVIFEEDQQKNTNGLIRENIKESELIFLVDLSNTRHCLIQDKGGDKN